MNNTVKGAADRLYDAAIRAESNSGEFERLSFSFKKGESEAVFGIRGNSLVVKAGEEFEQVALLSSLKHLPNKHDIIPELRSFISEIQRGDL